MLLGLGKGLLGLCLSLGGPQAGVAGTDIGQGREMRGTPYSGCISLCPEGSRRMQMRLGQWVMCLEHPQGNPEPPDAWGVPETLLVPLCERSIVIPRK